MEKHLFCWVFVWNFIWYFIASFVRKLEYERYWLTKTKKKGYEILNRDILNVTSSRDLIMYVRKDIKERAFILGI